MRDNEPTIGDAFGEALQACCTLAARHGVITQIIERDDGFVDASDMADYFAPPDRWNVLDRWACDSLVGRVLDVGAGAGRHALLLQDRGCSVTALDVSALAADVCRKRGVRDVFTGTVEELCSTGPEPFDAFILLGNNLGLLKSRDYAPQLLVALASISRPGAQLVGTCLDPYQSDHPDHVAYHAANRAAGRMAGQLRLRIRHERLATPWWEYLFMSPDELRALTADTGWEIVDQLSDASVYAVRMRLSERGHQR